MAVGAHPAAALARVVVALAAIRAVHVQQIARAPEAVAARRRGVRAVCLVHVGRVRVVAARTVAERTRRAEPLGLLALAGAEAHGPRAVADAAVDAVLVPAALVDLAFVPGSDAGVREDGSRRRCRYDVAIP